VCIGGMGKGVEKAVGHGHDTKERGVDPVLSAELAPTMFGGMPPSSE
jgi:hypothetical protein